MHQDRRAGSLPHLLESADMVNMRVRVQDSPHFQIVPGNDFEDAFHFVARVNDDSFACLGIAHHRTVALKQTHRQDLVD
jgi:hypothetical protein